MLVSKVQISNIFEKIFVSKVQKIFGVPPKFTSGLNLSKGLSWVKKPK